MSDKTTEAGRTAQYKDIIIEDAYWQIFINDSARLTLCRNALLVRRAETYFFFCIISLGLCAEDYILIYCLLWLDLCLSLGLNHILFTADLLYYFLSVLLFCPNIAV